MNTSKESAGSGNAGKEKSNERQHSPFSPHTSHSVMNGFFNKKGPIKPPGASDQPSAMAIQNMIQQTAMQQRQLARGQLYDNEDYYDEEEDYNAHDPRHLKAGEQNLLMMQNDTEEEHDGEGSSDGASPQRMNNNRQLSREEEEMILGELLYSAQDNREFMKVLHILQNDGELRPLIFEHEALLRTLKDMRELKAEQMLSILTAAETEMYESSKKNEELIQAQKMINNKDKGKSNVSTEDKAIAAILIDPTDHKKLEQEVESLKTTIKALQKTNDGCQTKLKHEQQNFSKLLEAKDSQLKEEVVKVKQLRAQVDQHANAKTTHVDDKKSKRTIEMLNEKLKELQNELRKEKANAEMLEQKIKLYQQKEMQIKRTNEGLEQVNINLNRKLTEQFKTLVLAEQKNSHDGQHRRSPDLGLKANFNLLRKLDSRVREGRSAEDHDLQISRPRRRSVDVVQCQNSNDLNSIFKQSVSRSLRGQEQLREEIQNLKKQNRYLQQKMQNFKGAEENKKGQQLVTFEDIEKKDDGLEETSYRLICVLRKLLHANESVDRFTSVKKPTTDSIKEIIFEISSKCDEMQMQLRSPNRNNYLTSSNHFGDVSNIEAHSSQHRAASQDSAENQRSQLGRDESPIASQRYPGTQNPLYSRSRSPFGDKGGVHDGALSNYASTADVTLILDEREKRLQTKEELFKCKEELLALKGQNEKLRREVSQERSQSFHRSQSEAYSERNDALNRQSQQLQQKLDDLKDENVTLKLKISEMESDILEERQTKQMKYDINIDMFKSQLHEQVLDQKVKFEEEILKEKEKGYKRQIEIQGLNERNQLLKEQLMVFRERITELEKENIVQSKENYILNCELDYENVRANQLHSKNENLLAGVSVHNMADIRAKDKLILEYERKRNDMEIEFKSKLSKPQEMQNEMQRLEIERLDAENKQLKIDIAKQADFNMDSLLNQPTATQANVASQPNAGGREYDKRSSSRARGATFTDAHGLNSQQVTKIKREYACKMLLDGMRHRAAMAQLVAFFKLQVNKVHEDGMQEIQRQKQFNQNKSMNEDTESKMELQDEIFKLQQTESDLVKQIGKIVRQVNQEKPVKLALSRLASKQTLGYVLSGLKGNTQVYELNLVDCGLEDDDLEKVAYRLMEDSGIKTLKLGQNQFTSFEPLIQLFQMKGQQFRALDISGIPIDTNAMQNGAIQAIGQIQGLEELNMSECLVDARPPDIKRFIDSLFGGCRLLRQIDISKNMLSKENLNHFLKTLSSQDAPPIECLALSQVNMQRESLSHLVAAVSSLTGLKKLNVSGNEKLGSLTLQQILKALIKNNTIEDLDVSKTGATNDQQCMQLLGELIQSNQCLRSLNLQKLALSEVATYPIIVPLSSALNVEALQFDYNNLGPIFVQNLVDKLVANKRSDNIRTGSQSIGAGNSPGAGSRDSSILTDETESNAATTSYHPRSGNQDQKTQGLISLSFEGNTNIGDRGAQAIAHLIQTQNAFSNNLKVVNLNECGITNAGFEHLKQALRHRAAMANSLHLTHVKITIERNNIEEGDEE